MPTPFPEIEPGIKPSQAAARPWYREPYVWLLIVIPAAALFAGAATLCLAIYGADIELPHPP